MSLRKRSRGRLLVFKHYIVRLFRHEEIIPRDFSEAQVKVDSGVGFVYHKNNRAALQ